MFPDVDDDGSTGAFVGRMSLNAARSELETAGERQREIDGFMAVENKKLEVLKAERAVNGSGRPNTAHSSKVKAAGAKIARLMRNILPSEQAPYVPRTMFELVTSAATHPQHHAAAGAVPAGRRSDAKRSRDADDDDDDDETGGGGDDDDGESTEFRQYYHVSPAQQAFNEEVAHGYMHNELLRSEITVYPDNLLASGCKQELVGLGPVHVCAPQLHMGLPLTPCPRHGWAAVDGNKVRTKGMCAARRVYAESVDEWLVGTKQMCSLCKGEREERKAELAELQVESELPP